MKQFILIMFMAISFNVQAFLGLSECPASCNTIESCRSIGQCPDVCNKICNKILEKDAGIACPHRCRCEDKSERCRGSKVKGCSCISQDSPQSPVGEDNDDRGCNGDGFSRTNTKGLQDLGSEAENIPSGARAN